jgi:hypothetical protein
MGPLGLEYLEDKSSQVLSSKALSGDLEGKGQSTMVQNPVHLIAKNSDLMQVVESWSNLPEHIKQTIMTLVGSVTIDGNDNAGK